MCNSLVQTMHITEVVHRIIISMYFEGGGFLYTCKLYVKYIIKNVELHHLHFKLMTSGGEVLYLAIE